MAELLSTMPIGDWTSGLTLFNGFYATQPSSEISNEPWAITAANIAPGDGPVLVAEKDRALYFISSALRVAPLIGKTLERAKALGLPTIGKQRSSEHVTSSSMLVADLDGISEKQLAKIESNLRAAGLTNLIYSSHSHGRPDKPGVRCRLVLPVDESLNSPDYSRAAAGLNVLLLGGLADVSGFKLCQQQGTWATAPERAHLAFRRVYRGGVCSAAALIAAVPKVERRDIQHDSNVAPVPLCGDDLRHVETALKLRDPNDYSTWAETGLWLRAAYGDAAYPVWLAWSLTADENHRADDDTCTRKWAELVPRIPAGAGAGKFFGTTRDEAKVLILSAAGTGQWGTREKAAVLLLKSWHKREYAQLIG